MRTPTLIAILFPALLLTAQAHAAQWVTLSNKNGLRIEIDSASMHTPGEGKTRLWHRETHNKPVIPESGAFSFTRLTTLTEFQCDKRLAAAIQRSYSAADGSELKSESPDSREPSPVAPDTSLETVLRYACKPKAKPVAEAPPPPPPPPPPESKEAPRKTKGGKNVVEEPVRAPHWSYTGNTGADKWGSLSREFATCSLGQRQSPIDIRKTVRADLPAIEFAYKPVSLSIVDNGHSIKVDTPGAGSISVDGETYDLLHFTFHKPSEEKINGKSYAMAAHLVHQSKSGKLAIVAVLMEAGKEQPLIRTLWNNLPLEQDKPLTRAELKIDPGLILPGKRNYYTFHGSLTTPPCTEGVLWLILKTPVQVSKEQLSGIATVYKNNVRPVQAVNGRVIKESR